MTGSPGRYAHEWTLDHVLEDSFPASDPPSWTLGVEAPEPLTDASTAISDDGTDATAGASGTDGTTAGPSPPQ